MQLDPVQESALIELVRETSRREILPRFRRLSDTAVKAKLSQQDLVTEADLASEAAISAGVRRILPQAAMIGEEAVAVDPALLEQIATADMAVILDPVDGTWNYAKGLSLFGMILAVTVRGETVFGLLYDPVVDDWVLARKGGGSWFCQPGAEPRRLQFGPDSRSLSQRNGVFSPYHFPQAQRPQLALGMLEFGRSYALRCSCHEYRMLAQGVFDFSLSLGMEEAEIGINPWDHAAGALVVVEAGGAVGVLEGGDYAPTVLQGRLINACSPECLEQVRDWCRRMDIR
ncbi:MAG TPA: inositol monophosphatase family protein [Thiolinea sp.]|nr:inositol monophosphatase family protein [Thiolinea sp.]